MTENKSMALVVGAIIVVLLQIVVAPNIALGSVVPNFLLAYCLTVALVRPHSVSYWLPFILGLLFDLMGGGPVGAMAFLLTLVTFLASRVYIALNNDTAFMLIVTLFVAVFAVELLYGVLLMAFGSVYSLLAAFLYRSIPCGLYDCIWALIMYPVVTRLMSETVKREQTSITQLR